MTAAFPPQPSPDPEILARARARLLADVSRLETGPTAADDPAIPGPSHVSWIGPQGAWEAASREDAPASERYRFGAVFARGGLGAVRRAEDRKLGRTVAVKELLRFDDKAVRRFVREAAITARLQHPGIVPLYDLGRDAGGRPFLCMKLVEGASLEQKLAACPDLSARLGLLPHVIAAADAVAYAHHKGVIHRDLKPANILVGELGEAVVIDWGLAKDLSQPGDEAAAEEGPPDTASDMTAAGSLLGTLRYMPPEQARGEAVDARSDVYALGAVLYHVIAGVPPFHDRRSAQLVRDVLDERPRPLSSQVPGAPPALSAIVEKAMAKEPGRRYADVAALAGDLRRFQAGLLVGAHSYSPAELARLWLRRHRAVSAVAAASLVALGVLGVLAFARIGAARDAEVAQRVAAESARQEAEARADEAESARRTAAERAEALVLAQARLTLEVEPSAAFGLLAQSGPDPAREGAVRTLATAAWSLGLTGAPMRGPTEFLFAAAHLSDGTWMASGHDALWRWQPGATEGERIGPGGRLAVTPAGDAWAIVRGGKSAEIEVHRVGEAEPRRLSAELPVESSFYRWTLPPGAATVIAGSSLGMATFEIEVASGRVLPLPGPDAPPAVAGLAMEASPDGRRLAGVREGRTLVVWDRETGAVATERLPGEAVHTQSGFSPDGRTYVQPVQTKHDEDRTFEGDHVFVWREGTAPRVVAAEFAAAARDAVVFLARREGRTEAWAETHEGRRLWTRQVHNEASDDFFSTPWTSRDGRLVAWYFGRWEEVVDVASGTLLSSQGWMKRDMTILGDDALLIPTDGGLVRVDAGRTAWRTLASGNVADYGTGNLSPSGRWAVRHAQGGLARIDLRTGASEALPDTCGPWTRYHWVAIDDGGRALVTDNQGRGCLFGQGSTDILSTPRGQRADAVFAPDGGRFAAVFHESLVEWSGPEHAPREWPVSAQALDLQYAPDSSSLALLDAEHRVTVIGRDGEARPLDASPHPGEARAIAFAPTGATLAVRRSTSEVTLHDLATGAVQTLKDAGEMKGQGLRFSPSGQTLALLGRERVWLRSLASPGAPRELEVAIGRDAEFLDERTLVIVTNDGGLEIVDLDSGTRAPLRRETSGRPRTRVAATPEGLVLLTWSGEVLRFTNAVPTGGEPLRAWLRESAVF